MTSPLPYQPGDPGQLMTALADTGRDLEQAFARADRIYAKVQRAIASGRLSQPPFSFTDDQVAWLDRITTDLRNLRRIAYGQAVPGQAYDYMAGIGQESGFR